VTNPGIDFHTLNSDVRRRVAPWLSVFLAVFLVGCALEERADEEEDSSQIELQAAKRVVRVDHSDAPLAGIRGDTLERFRAGDELFEAVFRATDGLGPLYLRSSCNDCHQGDGRGPARVRRFGHFAGEVSQAERAALFPFGDLERPYALGGAEPIVLKAGNAPHQRVVERFPPAVFARGYIDAVDEVEIERLAKVAAARSGLIRGRIARVSSGNLASARAGRFGLKARTASLDEFVAQALHDDMGLTSPAYPEEAPNPSQRVDDEKSGVDVDESVVRLLSDYVRLLAMPERKAQTSEGVRLFDELSCSVCHVPSLRTYPEYPIAELRDIEAPIYSDLLLHDMGEALSDGVSEGTAGPREWRTAPLVGLRFSSALLHDGRALSLREAILLHGASGSEAFESAVNFSALPLVKQEALLIFVAGL